MNKFTTMFLMILFLPFLTLNDAYYSTCVEDANRQCPNSDNLTSFLETMKKGGTDILSTDTYMYDFILCEEFNYDCGYQENQDSYTTISNGVQLTMNQSTLSNIFAGTNQTLESKISPYLESYGEQARCGMNMFPLTLTSSQSKQFLDRYMQYLEQDLITQYNSGRFNGTSEWSKLNINIRTGVLYMVRKYPSWIGSGQFWNDLILNDFAGVSACIKKSYESTESLQQLHAAYLIDSVTVACDKLQSVNFLVDQSGSITAPNFEYVRDFLELYINTTNDDLSMVSIHFYSNTFEHYLGYGNDYNTFLTQIRNKPYNGGGTLTGNAINATIPEIQSGNFLNGVPTIMAVMTDGVSYDNVLDASNYARSKGITMIAIGVGPNINDAQLLQIAQTSSNIIKIDSYDKIEEAVEFLFNYFCKQIITVNLGDSILGNYVRVPTSPSYFRVVKDTEGQTYELDIQYEDDPTTHQEEVVQSQIDPFPDEYTEYENTQFYELFRANPNTVGDFLVGNPKKVYFIQPENVVSANVKKNNFVDWNASVSYVAVRGVGLGFNISLKNCTTLTCEEEKAQFQQQQSTFITLYPEEDLSIFIIIGCSLAGLACLSILLIFGIRRCQEEEEKKKKQSEEENETEENLDEQIMPNNSQNKIKEKSNKASSSKSSRSSSKSSRSSQKSKSKSSNSSKQRSKKSSDS